MSRLLGEESIREVVTKDFPTIPVIDEVVYGLGECSRYPPYDRESARLQGIYITLYSKWSSPIDRVYEGTTIPLLHAWRWCTRHAIQVIVHGTKLEPAGGSPCVAR